MAKIYGKFVDVASYQSKAVTAAWWKNAGANAAVVKLSQGTGYNNPFAKSQIAAAKNAKIAVHGYHFANFTENSASAVAEAKYAIATAKTVGLPKSAIIVLDFEAGKGDKVKNTAASIAFLTEIKKAGYRPVFYSYQGMASHYDANKINKAVGGSLWIAAYPLGTRASETPSFNYFPSVADNTSAWQFTDNFKGNHVDGSVDLTGEWISQTGGVKAPVKEPAKKPATPAKKPVFKKLVVDGKRGVATNAAINLLWGSVKGMQKAIGTVADGIWKTKTTTALQKFLNKNGAKLKADGIEGVATDKALQTYLNKKLG